MTRACWTAARAGCTANFAARSFHSITTLLATAGADGRADTSVLAPVPQAALNNGHTEIVESATARLRVNTNPLLNLLLLMFSSFCSGLLLVKAGLADETCNAELEKV